MVVDNEKQTAAIKSKSTEVSKLKTQLQELISQMVTLTTHSEK